MGNVKIHHCISVAMLSGCYVYSIGVGTELYYKWGTDREKGPFSTFHLLNFELLGR